MLLLGQIGLWGGSLSALAAVVLFLMGRSGDRAALSARRGGYYATFLSLLLLTVSVVVIVVGFMTKNFTMAYVAQNHPSGDSSLMWLYNISGLWTGREGSLLLWAWIITLFTGFMALKGAPKNDDLSAMALMVLNLIVVFFGAFMLLARTIDPVTHAVTLYTPFTATPANYLVNGQLVGMASGWGMNPLLQHWAMILHPPTLFIGYAGLSVPLAYALGALIVNDGSDRWVRACDRTTIFAWLFLTIGIGLGAIWAYVVLGWGGFWGWDPVENGSILPWFVGVALIHSFTMYRRKGNFKVWTVILTGVTFVMVIMGTWITRSGLIRSVHQFADSIDKPVTYAYGALMIVALLAVIIGALYRRDSFRNTSDFESLTSKEAGYYFNNLFMLISSVVILGLTTAPALIKTTYSTTTFETAAHYMGIIYIAIMAICPLLKWGKTGGKALWDHIKLPLLVTIVPFGLLMWNWISKLRPVYSYMVAQGNDLSLNFTAYGARWLYDATSVIGFLLASFLIVNTLFVFIDGARARSKATGDGFGKSLGSIITKARTQSGGMIVHIAVAIIVIGLVGAVMYVREVKTTISAKSGTTLEIADYTLTLKSVGQTKASNGDTLDSAVFGLKKGGRDLGEVSPSYTTRATTQQTSPHAVIKSEVLQDLFIALDPHDHTGDTTGQTAAEDTTTLVMDVRVNPLISFIWAGVVLMMVGTVLADWPKKKRVEIAAAPEAASGSGGKSGAKSGAGKSRK
ncbi:MAG: cytochrome c biogenesis protein CcsA [Coriobacteriia bacterium]|nr:cytochrome c biogenesis protein CcsA [Coriobacteriia bacterium]